MERLKLKYNNFKRSMGQWTYSAYCFFHVETDSYFPGRDFHVSRLHPESNDEYPSTGMVQPPVLAHIRKCIKLLPIKKDVLDYQRKY
jgi:hypothetical protein